MSRTTIIILTWQRIKSLPATLHNLARQTNKNFDVIISNSNKRMASRIEEYAQGFSPYFKITVRQDSNRLFALRRMLVAREAATNGSEIILFIDDDILIPPDYVAKALQQYEPNSYKSQFAWKILNGGNDYYKERERIFDVNKDVNYCGTAVSMVDAKLFLEEGLFDYPEEAVKIEDLWMSYYAQHVLKWKLQYMDISDVKILGGDRVALYKTVAKDQNNKKAFLHKLVDMGWKI